MFLSNQLTWKGTMKFDKPAEFLSPKFQTFFVRSLKCIIRFCFFFEKKFASNRFSGHIELGLVNPAEKIPPNVCW